MTNRLAKLAAGAVRRMFCLFALTARCNHACEPNAEVRSEQYMDGVIDLVATRDIQVGEEITISYISVRNSNRSGSHLSCLKRQRELQAKYLFHCTCERCQKEGAPAVTTRHGNGSDRKCHQQSVRRRRRPRILLGVTGSVAAVKAPEIAVRLSREVKADVRVLLSRGGRNFWDKSGDYNEKFWKVAQRKIEASKPNTLDDIEQGNNMEEEGCIHLHGMLLQTSSGRLTKFAFFFTSRPFCNLALIPLIVRCGRGME